MTLKEKKNKLKEDGLILYALPMTYNGNYDEEKIKKESFAITSVLTQLEKSVLSLLLKNPLLPVTELANALKVEQSLINQSISNLFEAGALDKDFKPTADAEASIQTPEDEIFIVYKYIDYLAYFLQ